MQVFMHFLARWRKRFLHERLSRVLLSRREEVQFMTDTLMKKVRSLTIPCKVQAPIESDDEIAKSIR